MIGGRDARTGARDARHCVSTKATKPHGTFGFTLIEVLVSMTILAMAIALSVSLISKSLSNVRRIEARTQIVNHANSVMELTLLDQDITEPVAFDGDFEDGTRWTMKIEDYVPDDVDLLEQGDMPVRLLSYTLEMFQPHSNVMDYRLRTLKLVPYQSDQLGIRN